MSVKKIVLECPQCHKSKLQKIPESLMEQRNQIEKGIVAVLIPEATLCAHGFIVYIDMNFSIRDTVTIDEMKKINKQRLVNLKTIEDILANLNQQTLKSVISKL